VLAMSALAKRIVLEIFGEFVRNSLRDVWIFFSGWDLWCFAGVFAKNGVLIVVF
jgi:hypothetical protein